MISELVLTAIIFALIFYIAWQAMFFGRQIDALTSKLMATDFREYAIHNKRPEPKKDDQPKKKPVVDDTLGANF